MKGIYRKGRIVYTTPSYTGLYRTDEIFKPKLYGGETYEYEISENCNTEGLIENEKYTFSVREGKAIILED